MAEPLVPGSSRYEVEIAIAKLKKYRSPGSDQTGRTDSSRRRNITVVDDMLTLKWILNNLEKKIVYNKRICFGKGILAGS
jgi:hypothetical protein